MFSIQNHLELISPKLKMKVFVLFAVIAVSQAAVILHGTGSSQQYRSQDGLGNYAFGYDEGHATGGTFRRESGAPGAVAGSYGLTDADGRQRVVNYVADAAGFRADVKTNEPGVEPKDPAATSINKAGVVVAAPALHHAAVVPAPALHHAAPAALHYAAPHAGAFAYSSAVGHHGLGHHGLGHYAAVGHPLGHSYYTVY